MKLTTKAVSLRSLAEVRGSKPQPSAFLCCEYSKDGKHFALGDNLGNYYICQGAVPKCRVEAHKGYVGCVLFRPDEIISCGADGLVKKWEYGVGEKGYFAKEKWVSPERLEIKGHDFEMKPRACGLDP